MFLKKGMLLMITVALLVFVGQASAQVSLALSEGGSATVSGQGTKITVDVSQMGITASVNAIQIVFDIDTSVVTLTGAPAGFLITNGNTAVLLSITPAPVPASASFTFTTATDVTGMEFSIGISAISLDNVPLPVPLPGALLFNVPQLYLDTQIESPAENNNVLELIEKQPGDTIQFQLFAPDVAGQQYNAFRLELSLPGKTASDYISTAGRWISQVSGDNLVLTLLSVTPVTVSNNGYLGQIDLTVSRALTSRATLIVQSAQLDNRHLAVSNAALTFVQAVCPGDFDKNGMINIPDFLLFVKVFGTSSGDATFNALMDMDGNGAVGIPDFLLFVDVFGTTCGTPPPPPPPPGTDYDNDNDGLIEIDNLSQLDAIRYDLDGDGVVDSGTSTGNYANAYPNALAGMGCPSSGCIGYELTANLDFDTNGNGDADADDAYWNDGQGWAPIGDGAGGYHSSMFRAKFEGNSHVISGLYINRREEQYVGFFGNLVGGAEIRDLGLVKVSVASGGSFVGGLAGLVTSSTINGSYVTGSVTGTGSSIGGLAGLVTSSTINGSYVTGSVTGTGGNIGGLVGANQGTISGSYATGPVTGTGGGIGGLVGRNDATISGSYATGPVNGEVQVGGLVGSNYAIIWDSYASSSVTGENWIGGLVGVNHQIGTSHGTISTSYASGSVTGTGSSIGGLVASNGGTITASYWDTQTSGQSTSAGGEGKTTSELQSPTSNIGIYSTWDTTVWDFGTSSQYPALKNLGLSLFEQRSSYPTGTGSDASIGTDRPDELIGKWEFIISGDEADTTSVLEFNADGRFLSSDKFIIHESMKQNLIMEFGADPGRIQFVADSLAVQKSKFYDVLVADKLVNITEMAGIWGVKGNTIQTVINNFSLSFNGLSVNGISEFYKTILPLVAPAENAGLVGIALLAITFLHQILDNLVTDREVFEIGRYFIENDNLGLVSDEGTGRFSRVSE